MLDYPGDTTRKW